MLYSDLVAVSEGAMALDEFARQLKAYEKTLSIKQDAKAWQDACDAYDRASETAQETGNWKPAIKANQKVIQELKNLRKTAEKMPDGDFGDVLYNVLTIRGALTLSDSLEYGENPFTNGSRASCLAYIDNKLAEARGTAEELRMRERMESGGR